MSRNRLRQVRRLLERARALDKPRKRLLVIRATHPAMQRPGAIAEAYERAAADAAADAADAGEAIVLPLLVVRRETPAEHEAKFARAITSAREQTGGGKQP